MKVAQFAPQRLHSFNCLLPPVYCLLFLVLFSCSPKKVSEPATGNFGGTLDLATVSDPKSFNLIVANETSTSRILERYVFEGLTKENGVTTEVEPNLAESWDISKDGLTWTFHLRKDVKWADGIPFTAADVVFTFNNLIFNPKIPNSSRDVFTIDGKLPKVEFVDDTTVRFILPKPFAPFLRQLTQPILPKHKLDSIVAANKFNEAWGLDTPLSEIVGTGPFILKQYVPSQRLVYERNPQYWKKDKLGKPLPYLERIVMIIVPDLNAELLKFSAGEIDALGMRPQDYSILKKKEKSGNYTVYNCGPNFGTEFVCFNLNPGKSNKGKPFINPIKLRWFNNLLFRQAVAHAIDKQSIINNIFYGLGYPQDAEEGAVNVFFHNPDVKKYPYDLAKAKLLLTQAGFTDRNKDGWLEDNQGNRVEFNLMTNVENNLRVDIANIIIADLNKLGLKVTLQAINFNTLINKINVTFDWDAILLGLTGGVEPYGGRNVWHSSGQLHLWNPRQQKPATDWESKIDSLFDASAIELDQNKRKQLFDEFQNIVAEELPVIYTVNQAALYAVKNKFGNVHPTAFLGVFYNIEEIYIKK
jgi:peptide/nickel transport system substrate-binding protein